MRFDEYVRHDAMALADLVRRKEVTPRELVDVALSRIDQVNGRINAVIHRLDDDARKMAEGALPEGPFRGLPFLVKDLDGTLANAPLNLGTRALRDYRAPSDTELIARYRRAGVVFLGKTNTPELGLLAITEPELHGVTRNPWNLDHVPGGTSGGSASAVAAGIVPVAHGGDGGGSIRIPASACGLFGLKATRGRMPLGPDVGESWHGLVVPGVLTRSVRDCAAFLDASHGPDVGAPYVAPPPPGRYLNEVGRDPGKLRVGFTTRSILGETTHPDCVRATEEAVALMRTLGHDVSEVTLPVDKKALQVTYLSLVAAGTAQGIADTERLTGRKPRPEDFEATTWFLGQVGHALSGAELEAARATLGRTMRTMGRFFEDLDILITPTLAHPPVRIGELQPKSWERAGLAVLRRVSGRRVLKSALYGMATNALEKTPNTMLFNMTGQPAMSVPLSWNDQKLPIGVQFVGRFGEEHTLLRLASQLEQARPWFNRRPEL